MIRRSSMARAEERGQIKWMDTAWHLDLEGRQCRPGCIPAQLLSFRVVIVAPHGLKSFAALFTMASNIG